MEEPMDPSTETPRAAGFTMPAEWSPHAATWIAWPHNVTDWPGKFHPIPWVFAEIVKHLSEVEPVRIIVRDERHERTVARILHKADAWRDDISFFHAPTNRCWTRDSLPTFVVNTQSHRLGAVKWFFNAWAKYEDWQDDQAAGVAVAQSTADLVWCPKHPKTLQPFVLEGGAIDVNGAGLLLATEECLLSAVQERNPGASRADYEEIFYEYLGAESTIWLAGGIAGDDTHGHIDDVARFVGAKKIVVVVDTDRSAPHYAILQENVRRLHHYQSAAGGLEIIELPLPHPIVFDGQRLPASYANFYIANNKVLVPVFNDKNDRIALNILQELFPDRDVIGIYCGDLVLGLGTLHCMTQQQPAI